MPKFGKKDILHVAKLARLEISEAEVENRLEEFNQIVEYIEKLSRLDTKGIEPTSQVGHDDQKLGTFMAPDEPGQCFTPDEAVKNAPARQDHFFMVPRLIEDTD